MFTELDEITMSRYGVWHKIYENLRKTTAHYNPDLVSSRCFHSVEVFKRIIKDKIKVNVVSIIE
jgi:hypothetical protein